MLSNFVGYNVHFFPKFSLGFPFILAEFFLNGIFISKFQLFQVKMAPKAKDSAWVHCDVIDGKMVCKLVENVLEVGVFLD